MTYKRNIPEDLINEGKLLNCLGRLIEKLETDKLPYEVDVKVEIRDFDAKGNHCDGFSVSVKPFTESIYVDNLHILLNNEEINFYCPRNSKYTFPLEVILDDIDYIVFNEQGDFHHEFILFLGEL